MPEASERKDPILPWLNFRYGSFAAKFEKEVVSVTKQYFIIPLMHALCT